MAKRQLAAKTATTLFVSLLTISLGSLSAPALAADEDPGWYFGLQGGVGNLSDTDNEVVRQGTAGTPGELGLLGLGLIPEIEGPICASPLSDLCSPVDGGTPGTPTQTSFFTTQYKNGTAFGLNLGYGYAGGIRPEVSIFHRDNDVESVAFGQGNGTLTGTETRTVDGSATSTSVMGSIWYDFNKNGSFRPYLGMGIGAAQVGYDKFVIGTTTIADADETVFAYQVGGGLAFRVGDNAMLSLDLRYLGANDAEVEGTAATDGDPTKITLDYKHTSAMLGFRYYLRAGALSGGDADGDGVPDSLDKCPDTPLGVAVDANGCPMDSDGDGIADNLDKCPGTPAGVTVGPDGCPLDSDADGVPDYLDKCPGTPPGTQVGSDGCPLDADGDGVADALDKCPGSPAGVAVGPDGCPLDSDNDGVPDNLDKCPGTPAGAVVDANGCEPDGDGDGIPDRLDRCPDTPPGEKVGPSGCPNDSDGDGVPDDQDECPNTPAGAKVLANGCALKGDCRTPRPGEEVDENGCAVDQTFILRGVNFEFDSDRLTPEAKEILRQVAQTLLAYPDVNVEIAGHTDSTGTDAYNLGLSEKRSIAVKNFLTTQNVPGTRMSPNGYGETQPIDTNDTEDGQAKNRRVELRVVEEESTLGQ